ncbi:uncharacterized protein ACNS7B_013647 isoform 2-T3 [Menidia menidia]
MQKDQQICDSSRTDMSDFPKCNGIRGLEYLEWVSNIVSQLRKETFTLPRPAGATLTVGPVEDSVYGDDPGTLNGCGKFFLPSPVKMQAVGFVVGTPFPCEQLLVMTGEDKAVYAFDGDELHLVASSLNELCSQGIIYPASKSYYRGEAFKDMTNEDWDKVRQGPVGQKLAQEHHKLVSSHKSRLLANLKISAEKKRCHQQHGKILPDNIFSQFGQKEGS